MQILKISESSFEIDNQYVFQPFRDFHNGQMTEEEWQSAFQKSKSAARRALGNTDTPKGYGGEACYTVITTTPIEIAHRNTSARMSTPGTV